jgi:2-methylcitrate dehydratase PrpD
MDTLTDRFIDDLYALNQSRFSDEILHQAKKCLLDYIGVTFVGSQMIFDKGNKIFEFLENIQGNTTVIGFDRKVNIENTVLINGLSAHVAELDDGSRFGAIHPGSPIISALLPMAEKENISGEKLLSGIIIGYEAAIRLAHAIQPSHYDMGYHPTATCGTIGAAIGLSAMLNFTKEQMKNAFSTAAISAAGSLKVLDDVSELKSFNVGRAALVGLWSAIMAKSDFKGPNDVLSGETGFLLMMSEKPDLSILTSSKKNQLYIEKIYFKPYASCRHTHPAIEASIKIRRRDTISIGNIKKIKVTTYKGVIGKHDYTEIHGEYSAKMSIPYSVAISLLTGKAGMEEFAEKYITDPNIISLVKKVEICSDDEISALVPLKRAAIVEVSTYDDVCFSERIDYPKGEPENPLSDIELEEKFLSLAQFAGKSKDECEQIIKYIRNLSDNMRNLLKLL